MQNFTIVKPGEIVADSLLKISNSIETVASNFSGTAFPTDHLIVGMSCYREDLGKKYTLKSIDPLKWEADNSYADQAANAATASDVTSAFENNAFAFPISNFRTTIFGSSNGGTHAKPFRVIDVSGIPHNSGFAWGVGDTHGFIHTQYGDGKVFVGGGNGDVIRWYKQLATTDAVLPLTGGTLTGEVHVPQLYNTGWYRSIGDTGWYSETHGGGWHMSDDTWIRAYNGKDVYTQGLFQADGGFNGNLHGTADFATLLNPLSGDANYKLGYTADGQRTNAGEWGRVVMRYAPNGQTYGVRVDRADNADAVGGYTADRLADTLRNRIAGRNTPVLTPLINWSQAQDIGSNSGAGQTGQGSGDIYLKQSYKNFDKILVHALSDDATWSWFQVFEKWELDYAFGNTYRFILARSSDAYWMLWSSVNLGTSTHPLSTESCWKMQEQSCRIKEIYGLTY